jgi:hypothetical protein
MVDQAQCEHCHVQTSRPVAQVIDGKTLNFCCNGCLQVYKFLREDGLLEKVRAEETRANDSVNSAS